MPCAITGMNDHYNSIRAIVLSSLVRGKPNMQIIVVAVTSLIWMAVL